MKRNYFMAFFKNSPAAYAYYRAVLDEQGIPYEYELLEINEAYENMMGVKPLHVIGKKASDIYQSVSGENLDKWYEMAQSAVINNKTTEMNIQYPSIDKWLRLVVFPLDQCHFASITTDITKEHMQEKEIEGFLNTNLDILYVTDLDYKFHKVNKRFENVLGYKLDEIEEKNPLTLVHVDDIAATLAEIKKLKQHKSIGSFVNRCRCKDGSYKYLEWRCEAYGKYVYSSARDVTEKQKEKTELLIKTQLDLLNNIIGNLEVGFVRYSYPEYKIIDINSKAYKDLKQINPNVGAIQSIIGMNKLNIFHHSKAEAAKLKKNIKGIADRKDKFNSDYRKITFQGEERFVKVIRHPLFGLNNEIIEMIDVAVDITDEIQVKNEMEKTIKIQEELLANVSHELKTPLSVIFCENQLMQLYLENGSLEANKEKIYKGINVIKQNCYRFMKLINNIVDLSKIKSGFFELSLSNENIVEVTEDIVQSVSEYIKGKGLNIIFDTNIEEKTIACDPEKIERIILNLISNAIKYSNPGGSIFVNMICKDDTVEISVRDKGIGIEKRYLKNIFKRFQRVDKSLSRNAEGSGMGLSLVKLLTEMHGGKISVDSEVGKGSIFKVELPARTVKNPKVIREAKQMNNKIQMINVEFSDIYALTSSETEPGRSKMVTSTQDKNSNV